MRARSVRLGLEQLVDRIAPSSVVGNAVATADWMTDLSGSWVPSYVAQTDADTDPEQSSSTPVNQKPVIKDFVVVVGPGLVGTFSGRVEDENPGGLTVTLCGAQLCLGDGRAVTTNEDGTFSYQGDLRRFLDTGYAYADVSDAQGQAAEREEYFVLVD